MRRIEDQQQRQRLADSKADFLEHVGHAFRTIQTAWSEQDLRQCRAFISDGVHERFELYLQMQKAEGIRNRVENLSIREMEIVTASSELQFDSIHVRITAKAEIFDESLDGGCGRKPMFGSSEKEFTEVWSFARRHGVQTRDDASVLAGQCPKCGASLEVVDKAECPRPDLCCPAA